MKTETTAVDQAAKRSDFLDGETQDKTDKNSADYITLIVDNQMFGIPVLEIRDILRTTKMTNIPLSPPEVEGSLNLRGHIVTAINVRRRLGLPEKERRSGEELMNVVVERGEEMYSLIVDNVGDVLSLNKESFESVPSTLDPVWRTIARGIYQMDDRLMVIADVGALLDFSDNGDAAEGTETE